MHVPNTLAAQTAAVSKCVSCVHNSATCQYILKDYIPAFRFGRVSSPAAVSVGINPAENDCRSRPLPLLSDYQRADRRELDAQNLAEISMRHDDYFSFRDAHPFFDHLQKMLWTINPKWTYGRRVAHIDVVSCVTDPTFGKVAKTSQDALLKNCREHFLNTLRLLPSHCWLVADGETALKSIRATGAIVREQDSVSRVKVEAGVFSVGTEAVKYVGWNYPAEKTQSNDHKREVAAMARSFIKESARW